MSIMAKNDTNLIKRLDLSGLHELAQDENIRSDADTFSDFNREHDQSSVFGWYKNPNVK